MWVVWGVWVARKERCGWCRRRGERVGAAVRAGGAGSWGNNIEHYILHVLGEGMWAVWVV